MPKDQSLKFSGKYLRIGKFESDTSYDYVVMF